MKTFKVIKVIKFGDTEERRDGFANIIIATFLVKHIFYFNYQVCYFGLLKVQGD